MGTTLTGTTPQDTYDSLIKVTDNGPLTGSLKKLTDGLGNDSSLSLSTTAASLSGTLAVTGNATFDTSVLVVDATNNRVGIGTASPTAGYSLSVVGAFAAGVGGAYVEVGEFDRSLMILNHTNASVNANLFQVQKSGTGVLTVNPAGLVGIGTSTPAQLLQVSGASAAIGINRTSGDQPKLAFASSGSEYASIIPNASNGQNQFSIGPTVGWGGSHVFITNTVERIRVTDNGLTFNGDSAAANALDDYEEGTWTMGVAFGGASVGVTYGANTGRYTKIGNQVTVTGYLSLLNKGSSTGTAVITGLPFAIGSGVTNFSALSAWLNTVTVTGGFQGYGDTSTTTINMQQLSVLGVTSSLTNASFANNSEVIISFTYFV